MTTFVNDNGSQRVPTGMNATVAWTGANGWGDAHTAMVADPVNPTGSGMAIEKRWYGPETATAGAGATTTYIPCQLKYASLPGVYKNRQVTINGQSVSITSYDGIGLTLTSPLSAPPSNGDPINILGLGTDALGAPGILSVWHWSSLNASYFPAHTLYVRMRVLFSPNWPYTNGNLGGMKFFYLQSSKSNTNIVWTSGGVNEYVHWALINSHGTPPMIHNDTWSNSGVTTVGQWHTLEFVFQMNSSLSTSDGEIQMFADGNLLKDTQGLMFVGSSDTMNSLDFDGIEMYPIRGSAGFNFDRDDFYRLGELYISGKP